MRLPENAARRSAESRGQGSLVPAPAGHIALWEDQPPPLSLFLGSLILPGPARAMSAGSAAQSHSEP